MKSSTLNVRLPNDLLARLDRLVESIRADLPPGVEVDRSKLMRGFIEAGVAGEEQRRGLVTKQ